MAESSIVISRRAVIVAAAATPLFLFAQTQPQGERPKRPPALEPEKVREFVGAAHGNLEKTMQMLEAEPGLLNATWDWGGGDFEMAIGGAGHMGRRDIAEFLIGKGGRYDIFVAAMLGQLELVKAALTANPSLKSSKGPHGIPLTVHAEKGGGQAAATLEYLKSIGAE
jgi:hypothetical protein